MRITYRSQGVKDYWTSRWEDIPPDLPMRNAKVYPLKYSEQIIEPKKGPILEAGCGAGRLLRYYQERGENIIGIDFVPIAIEKLLKADPALQVEVGDITNLRFSDNLFEYILAYGLYHNLETGLEKAIAETWRVLKPGGRLSASFRADNIQTRLTDFLADRKNRQSGRSQGHIFHKANATRTELVDLFTQAGFAVESVGAVENMPLLYKFRFFRARSHKDFDESKGRAEGYRLSGLGALLQKLLMRFLPHQFCNLYVLMARKPEMPSR